VRTRHPVARVPVGTGAGDDSRCSTTCSRDSLGIYLLGGRRDALPRVGTLESIADISAAVSRATMRSPAHISTTGRLRYSDAALRTIVSCDAAVIMWAWVAWPSSSSRRTRYSGIRPSAVRLSQTLLSLSHERRSGALTPVQPGFACLAPCALRLARRALGFCIPVVRAVERHRSEIARDARRGQRTKRPPRRTGTAKQPRIIQPGWKRRCHRLVPSHYGDGGGLG
jgi:hypothetical protein